MKWRLILLLGFGSGMSWAQETVHRFEVWPAYISSISIDSRYSIWNDFHWIPNSFFLSRHGLTRHFGSGMSVTGGYAWVRTTAPFTGGLARQEHRPWAQWEASVRLSPGTTYRFRLRYDCRFRRRIDNMRFEEDFVYQNRLRFMHSARFRIKELGEGKVLHFNAMNETLFQYGQGINGFQLDQNRSYLLWGLSVSNITILAGYHLRVIPGSMRTAIQHGFTCWAVQRFGA